MDEGGITEGNPYIVYEFSVKYESLVVGLDHASQKLHCTDPVDGELLHQYLVQEFVSVDRFRSFGVHRHSIPM